MNDKLTFLEKEKNEVKKNEIKKKGQFSLLSENHILILKETKKGNSFVVLNKINKKIFL